MNRARSSIPRPLLRVTDNAANRDVWTNVARIRDLVADDSSTLWFYTAGVGAAFETYRSSEDPKPKLIKVDNLVEKVQDVLGIQYVQEFGMGKGTLDRVQLGCELLRPDGPSRAVPDHRFPSCVQTSGSAKISSREMTSPCLGFREARWLPELLSAWCVCCDSSGSSCCISHVLPIAGEPRGHRRPRPRP